MSQSLSNMGSQAAHERIMLVQEHSVDTLDISNLRLTELPLNMPCLPSVVTIILGSRGRHDPQVSNVIETIPILLKIFPNLKALIAPNISLKTFPDWIFESQLEQVDLAGNRLADLSEPASENIALLSLSLSNNLLTMLPSSINLLRNLSSLELGGNPLGSIESIFGLSSIEKLSLVGVPLDALAATSAGPSKTLRFLDISGTLISELPSWVLGETMLERLVVSGNEIYSISDDLNVLSSLVRIDLSSNHITALPPPYVLPQSLRSLDLSYNPIKESQFFGGFLHLAELNLSNCELSVIPDAVIASPNLRSLQIQGNPIFIVRPDIWKLSRLQELNLSFTKVEHLPRSIQRLELLDHLQLEGLNLKDIPRPIITQGLDSILQYIKSSTAEEHGTPVRQWKSKLLLVGEGGAGKSCLLDALLNYPFDVQKDTTHGLNVVPLEIAHATEPDVMMLLSAWDFGGQEIYHATHQFFLTDRSLFLFIWNARLGYDQGRPYYWLDMIKARAPNAPILIVATHEDQRAASIPLSELKLRYPQIVDFVSISCKSGVGVDRLRRAVACAASNLPLMGAVWPLSWVKAMERIRQSSEQYLPAKRFFSIFSESGLDDEESAVVAQALHDLGEILHFSKDANLKNFIVLSPTWVLGRISKVLTSDAVSASGGVLTAAMIAVIWKDLDPQFYEPFLDLMEVYDLSYRIPNDRDHKSLVVEQLPFDYPEKYRADFLSLRRSALRTLTLRYSLSSLQPGIPTWFIARSHRFTLGKHWRTGAVLADQPERKNVAWIEASRPERSLTLSVAGPYPHNLFSILKEIIEQTLSRYPGLAIERYVPCPGHGGKLCEHEFKYDDLLNASQMVDRRSVIQCPKSFQDVLIDNLLYGAAEPNASFAAIARMPIEVEVATLASQGTDLAGDYKRQTTDLIFRLASAQYRQIQRGEDIRCPYMFSLVRGKKSGLTYESELRLHLICQHLDGVHLATDQFTGFPQFDAYVIKEPKKWMREASVILTKARKFIKIVAPFARSIDAIKDVIDDGMLEGIDELKSLLEEFGNDSEGLSDLPATRLRQVTLSGHELRVFRRLLEQLDPKENWQGLSQVQCDSGHLLWLCRHHASLHSVAR